MPNQAYDRRARQPSNEMGCRGGELGERALASSVMECGNSLALISIGKRHDGGTQGAGRQAGS